jgi:hypothetical protein
LSRIDYRNNIFHFHANFSYWIPGLNSRQSMEGIKSLNSIHFQRGSNPFPNKTHGNARNPPLQLSPTPLHRSRVDLHAWRRRPEEVRRREPGAASFSSRARATACHPSLLCVALSNGGSLRPRMCRTPSNMLSSSLSPDVTATLLAKDHGNSSLRVRVAGGGRERAAMAKAAGSSSRRAGVTAALLLVFTGGVVRCIGDSFLFRSSLEMCWVCPCRCRRDFLHDRHCSCRPLLLLPVDCGGREANQPRAGLLPQRFRQLPILLTPASKINPSPSVWISWCQKELLIFLSY